MYIGRAWASTFYNLMSAFSWSRGEPEGTGCVGWDFLNERETTWAGDRAWWEGTATRGRYPSFPSSTDKQATRPLPLDFSQPTLALPSPQPTPESRSDPSPAPDTVAIVPRSRGSTTRPDRGGKSHIGRMARGSIRSADLHAGRHGGLGGGSGESWDREACCWLGVGEGWNRLAVAGDLGTGSGDVGWGRAGGREGGLDGCKGGEGRGRVRGD